MNIKWGGGRWSQVEATLNSMKQIIASGQDYGYVLFISGQDYPLMPPAEIARFLDENYPKEFIYSADMSDPANKRFEDRYKYLITLVKSKRWQRRFNRWLRKLPARKPPLPIVKGWSWFNFTGETIKYIVDFCNNNPKIVRGFKPTECPDEMFFQSILHASPIRERIVNSDLRFTDWENQHSHPRTLNGGDFEKLTSSGMLFARKIEAAQDGGLLDMLDAHIGRKNK